MGKEEKCWVGGGAMQGTVVREEVLPLEQNSSLRGGRGQPVTTAGRPACCGPWAVESVREMRSHGPERMVPRVFQVRERGH